MSGGSLSLSGDATTAAEIYQAHLDASTSAFWRRDWETALNLLKLPCTIELYDCMHALNTYPEYLNLMISQRDSLDRLGVTDYHRICNWAEFGADDQIKGQHTTYALCGAKNVTGPYKSDMPLVLEEGIWRAHGIRTDLRDADVSAFGPKILSKLRARRHIAHATQAPRKGASDAQD